MTTRRRPTLKKNTILETYDSILRTTRPSLNSDIETLTICELIDKKIILLTDHPPTHPPTHTNKWTLVGCFKFTKFWLCYIYPYDAETFENTIDPEQIASDAVEDPGPLMPGVLDRWTPTVNI